MTPTEMEEAINNCDLRLRAIEQILPTLATKADVREEILGLRREMRERIDAWRRHTDTRLDDVREDSHRVAAQLAKTSVQVQSHEPRFDAIDRRFEGVDTRFDAVDGRLDRHEDLLRTLVAGQQRLEALVQSLVDRERS